MRSTSVPVTKGCRQGRFLPFWELLSLFLRVALIMTEEQVFSKGCCYHLVQQCFLRKIFFHGCISFSPQPNQNKLENILVTKREEAWLHLYFTLVPLSPYFLKAASWKSNLHLAALTFLMPTHFPTRKNLLLCPFSKSVTILAVITEDDQASETVDHPLLIGTFFSLGSRTLLSSDSPPPFTPSLLPS